jgi:hypothetical protein
MHKQMLAFIVGSFVLLGAAAPVVADPVGMLVDHAQEKADQAGEDPVGFVEDHASQEGLERETDWTLTYACFAARETVRETGADPPELGVCPDYPAVAEEDPLEGHSDEATAEALDETEAIVGDALGTLSEVLGDPENAPGLLLGFIKRTTEGAKRLVDNLVQSVLELIDDIILPVNQQSIQGLKEARSAVVGVVLDAWDIPLSAQARSMAVWMSTGDAVAEGYAETREALSGLGSGLVDLVQGWFSQEETRPEESGLVDRDLLEVAPKKPGVLDDVKQALPAL